MTKSFDPSHARPLRSQENRSRDSLGSQRRLNRFRLYPAFKFLKLPDLCLNTSKRKQNLDEKCYEFYGTLIDNETLTAYLNFLEAFVIQEKVLTRLRALLPKSSAKIKVDEMKRLLIGGDLIYPTSLSYISLRKLIMVNRDESSGNDICRNEQEESFGY